MAADLPSGQTHRHCADETRQIDSITTDNGLCCRTTTNAAIYRQQPHPRAVHLLSVNPTRHPCNRQACANREDRQNQQRMSSVAFGHVKILWNGAQQADRLADGSNQDCHVKRQRKNLCWGLVACGLLLGP